jgi:hypothetical protein
LQAQCGTVKPQGVIEVGDTHHGVEVFHFSIMHGGQLAKMGCRTKHVEKLVITAGVYFIFLYNVIQLNI